MSTIIRNICGVYQIRCVSTNERYIGGSIMVHNRWYTHQGRLKRKVHKNRQLQRLYDKEEEFICELLLECDPNMVSTYEAMLIDGLKPELNIPMEEQNRTRSATLKRLFREGKWKPGLCNGREPWNKGLTKEDYNAKS